MTLTPLSLSPLFDEVIGYALQQHAALDCGIGELLALQEVVMCGAIRPFRQRQSAVYDLYTIGSFTLYLSPTMVMVGINDAYIGASATHGTVYLRTRWGHTTTTLLRSGVPKNPRHSRDGISPLRSPQHSMPGVNPFCYWLP